MICETPDFQYPLLAEVFHPIVEQGAYGNVKKQWILDRKIALSVAAPGSAKKEDVKPNVNITKEMVLVGRTQKDLRISDRDSDNSITNIVISNIQDKNCNHIYKETSGTRKGKSTIFEVASVEPFVGPFGNVEFYNFTLRRSENQAVDV